MFVELLHFDGEEKLRYRPFKVDVGIIRGSDIDGDLFGAARYPDAIVSSLAQFDFCSGGGLDIACLSMAELDRNGNVNVSRLGPDVVGPGGFVDITQNARTVLYVTERAVFRLVDEGIELIEIADGVELERDVLERMAFRPTVSPKLGPMAACHFSECQPLLHRRSVDPASIRSSSVAEPRSIVLISAPA